MKCKILLILGVMVAVAFAAIPYEELDKTPEPLTSKVPEYSEEARSQGYEGKTLIKVLIDKDGTVKKAKLEESSGHEELDNAALEAAQKWTFIPAKKENKTVETWAIIPFHFKLDDGAIPLSELDAAPAIESSPPPEYPIDAKNKSREGKVIVSALIDTDGSVIDVEIKKTSGFEDLDNAAIEAVEKWTFSKPERDGKPVKTRVMIPVSFKLDTGEGNCTGGVE